MIQDPLFDLPGPAPKKTRRKRHELPPGAPWLDQYPRPELTGEEKRQYDEKCRQEIRDWLDWWTAFAAAKRGQSSG